MPNASNEIVVNRPIGDVFAFLADAQNDPKWRRGVLEIAHVSGARVGARYRQGVKGPGGRRIAAHIEVTEHEPERVIGVRATTEPVRPRGRYDLTPTDHGTRIRFELAAQVTGLKRIMAPMVQKTMTDEVAQLDNLRDVLERAHP